MANKGIFSNRSDFSNRYIDDWDKLGKFLEHYREIHPGCTIGFVGGVWDLKHIAHDRYLEAAKDLVELLVVGVDTDEFTRARKKSNGPDRPIIPLIQRAEGISYLRSADLVTKVTEDFVGLLKAVKPDVLIFSKTTTDLAEKKRQEYGQYVGRIELLEPQAPPEEVSTTARIKSIAEAALKQAEAAAHSALERSFDELRKEL